MLNEQMEEEATTRPDILNFFGQEKFIFLGKSLGILKSYACGSHVHMYSIYHWNNYFQLNIPLNIQLFTTLYLGKWLDLLITIIEWLSARGT